MVHVKLFWRNYWHCYDIRDLLSTMGVLDYHTEVLLRREYFIFSTRFARMDPTECFFVFRLDRRMRGMADRWQC